MISREQLLNNFMKLTSLEKFVLQLISVIYEPCSRTTIVRCLQECQSKLKNVNLAATASIGVMLTKCQKLKLLNDKCQCNPHIVEIITRRSIVEGVFNVVAPVIQKVLPVESGPKNLYSEARCLREIRIALYKGDLNTVNHFIEKGNTQFANYFVKHNPYMKICNHPFDLSWFKQLPLELQTNALDNIIESSIVGLETNEAPLAVLEQYESYQNEDADDGGVAVRFCDTLANKLLFCTDLAKTKTLLKKLQGTSQGCAKQGWLHFLTGDYDSAYEDFELAIAIRKKLTKKKRVILDPFSSLFYVLTILRQGEESIVAQGLDYVNLLLKSSPSSLLPTYECLKAAIFVRQNKVSDANEIINQIENQTDDAFSFLFLSLALFWLKPDLVKFKINRLESLFAHAEKNGYTWIAFECAELLSHFAQDHANGQHYQSYANKLKDKTGIQSVVSLIKPQPTWQRSLNALQALSEMPVEVEVENRVVWVLNTEKYTLVPLEQKLSLRTGWSKGRAIALSRLYDHDKTLDFLSEQDKSVCGALKKQTDYNGNVNYYFEMNRALPRLAGHPSIFLDSDPLVPLELCKASPELIIEQTKEHILMNLSVKVDKSDVHLQKETPTRYKVVCIDLIHRKIAHTLGEEGLKIPLDAKDQVVKIITSISNCITVQSAIGGMGNAIPRVNPDSRPHIHLLPYGEGLKFAIFVKPISNMPRYFKPGAGGKTFIAEMEGERLQTRRNFSQERQLAQDFLTKCASLAAMEDYEQELILDNPEECLNALLELQSMGDDIVVEWPEGQKFKLKKQITPKALNLNIQKKGDLFALDGQIKLDEKNVISLKELLEKMKQAKGRFVPIGDDEFIALSKEFHRRLQELNTLVTEQEKSLAVSPLAAQVLENITNQAGELHADKQWRDHIKRLNDSQHIDISTPSTLKADLRHYQQEGFEWLSRLSYMGVGACLADDMGLGKTLQTLSAILSHAEAGPSLVIAPTSVGFNWIAEGERFTPSLTMYSFAIKNRKALLKQLGPFDVLVCSYGLLQQEIDLLKETQWQCIVLDEAQAIKNNTTKRSKAAMMLQGRFKVITTGTPIENHLGELWNLFQFANPGLLGSFDQFNKRFISPIEKSQSKVAKRTLKKLLQPFILRRTKNQVLDELPPRTEIVLRVEMSDEEKVFYEALREEAINKLSKDKKGAEQQNLQILAEITKLRQACCNPSLIDKNCGISSSKLELLDNTIDELLSNNHKALIFSQFVGHLKLIKQRLDQKNITYEYLDGSTPINDRKKAVDRFQAGHGDIFLISLKAGGTGLNLTAADYVIHMDPWWNPAVEDQASDRAHRLGQKRPVTIYRMIVEDSIEEKILALHQKKRDLASSLLEGTEITGKLTAEELFNLIKQ